MNDYIMVYFKDTFYTYPEETNTSFFLKLRVQNVPEARAWVKDLLNPDTYMNEVDGEYSYREWVEERLNAVNVGYVWDSPADIVIRM